MSNLKVPRQLMLYFGDDKEIQRFFQRLEILLENVGKTTLGDVAQQHSSSADSRVFGIDRSIEEQKKSARHVSLTDLEKKFEELKKMVRKESHFEINKRLDDIEKRLH